LRPESAPGSLVAESGHGPKLTHVAAHSMDARIPKARPGAGHVKQGMQIGTMHEKRAVLACAAGNC
jgi:hypothetical protein